MVDFRLSDDTKALRELAHDFAEREMSPVAAEYDRDGTWPDDVLRKAWEVGLMNIHTPEEYGGVALSSFDGVVVQEELAWGCSGIQTSLGANGLAATPILIAGSDEIKGDSYVITGSKCFITNGGYADWFTVFAMTDPEAGNRGISAFVVPKDDTVTVDKKEDKMGQRASNTATITFNDTVIPAKNLLGVENKGFNIAMATLDNTRPGTAAMAVGIARAAFEHACEYSKERVQFGVPIAMHQAIQFLIADMATEIEASRLLTWQSAVLLDQG